MKVLRFPIAVVVLSLGFSGAIPAQGTTQRGDTVQPWQIIKPPQSSIVLARDGSFIGEVGEEFRTSVPLASLPRYVPQAFVAIEDQRFYQHDGVDLIGIAGAI